jgi:hypothetical protein
MKKIIYIPLLLSLGSLFASEYYVTLDNKHYKNSIVIKPAEEITPKIEVSKNHIDLGTTITSSSLFKNDSFYAVTNLINGVPDNYPVLEDSFAWDLQFGITESVMRTESVTLNFNKDYEISRIGMNSRIYYQDVKIKEYKFIFSDGSEQIIEYPLPQQGIIDFKEITPILTDSLIIIPWSQHIGSSDGYMVLGEVSIDILE